MKKLGLYIVMMIFSFLTSCEKDNNSFKKAKIAGYVQKGPFNNGTSITISELKSDLIPTGRNFNSQITDNSGNFEISNVEFSSPYIELKASGYYFNEISGENSSAPLTLYALTDLSDSSNININILSNIEKNRVEYLISEGLSFEDSKKRAQQDILNIFEIDNSEICPSEFLNISKSGDDNGILLAISLILQGYRTTSELSELLANISTNVREDGELNDSTIGSSLINHAKYLITDSIRSNLNSKYNDLGLTFQIPDFEKYIQQFIENTKFKYTGLIKYPDQGIYGKNILSLDTITNISLDIGRQYSMNAIVPSQLGITVKIHFSTDNTWGIDPENSGWEYDSQLASSNTFIFYDGYTKENMDLRIDLIDSGSAIIEIFENNKAEPTRVKNIVWNNN